MSELPQGWVETPLEYCIDILDNLRVPVNSDVRQQRQGEIPYYGATGQVGWIDDHLFDEELLLVGEDGAPFLDMHASKAYIITGKSWVNNHAHVLRAIAGLTSNAFLKHYLNYFDYHEHVNGTTRLKLTQASLRAIPVSLPPLAEQRRIVAKLEQVLARVEACRARLETVPTLLKRFRQSVLAAACSGRLTEDWREEVDDEEAWATRCLSDIGSVTGGITKNSQREKMALQVPYLRVANVYENRLELDEVFNIGISESELSRSLLETGDLLFVEGNGSIDQIGRVALWDGSIRGCVHQNHLIKFRARQNVIPQYVLYQMMGPEGRAQLIEQATSTAGLHTLSISKISRVTLPIPSLAEQQEIVRRVTALFAFADGVAARYTQAKAHVDHLPQSILAKAFRGELVPQDPADEPASALLARIGAERQAATLRPRGRRSRA